jgi:GxxExxY protein
MNDVQLTHVIIGAAIAVHRELGPGLLELVYREAMCHELSLRQLSYEKEKPIPAVYKGVKLDCGYRADIVVCGRIVVEIKAISAIAPVHDAVMLTYLRLSGCKAGLLINFYSPVLKDGIKRYVWGYTAQDSKDES